ncbi:DNA-directed RNA polymerase II subunit [Morus notabilis]|uniref:DNA-directed RNA polymerase subunit n=1 Tax=Morus notabilis TaxID=981085 RepID=W9QJA8_9ROSA|nr:DNA-directed RNA polymerase V subunit 7 [Morus notabilis]EXB38410.1 DNA-directed RNA polymerase II subunit [Morus notabilis]
MFSEVELIRDVTVDAENIKSDGLVSRPQSFIMTRLLEDLVREKASKDHGYFLAVTSLKKIGKMKAVEESGDVFFPVVFNCRTFLPYEGEILQGIVHCIYRHGVFLRCGPIKYAYLSARKMPGYQYVYGQKMACQKCGHDRKPLFVSNEFAKIENGVVVCFMVLGVRWFENWGNVKNEFGVLATLEGDSLGPISLSGSGELDL